jgi:heptaprenyl diphosphate synthase
MDAVTGGISQPFAARATERDAEAALDAAEAGIRDAVARSDGVIRAMCLHILDSGGKRLRPRLVLRCGLMFSPLNGSMVNAAVAAELIHTASLLHDDVIDRPGTRRGRPAANRLWGDHAAVLCGDWLFARAFGLLSGPGMSACLALMTDAIARMCRGEILQAGNLFNLDAGPEAYFEQIAGKTAALMECCCRCGALAGGAGAAEAKALGGYGLNAGMAFQMADDLLDLRGDPAAMGKPAGEDIAQGVLTLPVLLLLRSWEYGPQARELVGKGNFSRKDLPALNALLDESGAMAEARKTAASFAQAALRTLEGLPEGESRDFLASLAAGVMDRKM